MKKVIISLLILSVGFACNSAPTKDISVSESEKGTISTVEEKKDTIQKNKPSQESLAHYFDKEGEWIQIKNALSADQAGIYVYFQAPDDVARNLRVRIQYGDASVYKFSIDGESYSYKANRSKGSDNRFVEGASFSWYDNDVKNKDLKFLQALSNGRNCQVILNDGSSFTISNETKTGIKRTLDYFEALDGLLPKTNMVNIRR
ncbi:hypothetical protein CLV62_15115 [Dysgonomonas alginatilytica]|uniref:Lipoprotein n=1 Tax=Dysgonomonas alginatilytica TaxID=1605892 RepID=A0A2V3PJB4_9BACT|nr:hypothetical protein [Dysgonomonas alginatilytica]PXV58120.1 hypothetical protein CLV62_15115 [Dysgonomonas alginatilytica]